MYLWQFGHLWGGGRGYGPTHSQSLESFLLGIPGFMVFNLNVFQDIEKTLEQIIINEKSIGGFDQLLILNQKGKLKPIDEKW